MIESRTSPCTRAKLWLSIGLLGLAFVGQAFAELPTIPDAGSIMRIQPRPLIPAPSAQPPLSIPQPSAPSAKQGGKLTPREWKIAGATLIPEAELKTQINDYLGRELSVQELWEAAQKLAMHYREQGYLVRAWLPEQEIRNGVVEIRVVEGKFDEVNVIDNQGVISADRAKETVLTAQGKGEILRLDDLERGVLLLNDMPGVSATPTLKQGAVSGTSALDLKIESRPTVNGILDYANAGLNSVGEHQFGGSLFINNAFGVGDQTTFRVQGGSGNVFGRLVYSMPVGYSGLRVGVAGSGMYYVLGNQFRSLDADGDAWVGGIFASYPVLRSNGANFYTLAGFDTRRYHNVALTRAVSDRTINVGYVGIQGDRQDKLLGGGFNNFSFYLSAGDVDLTDNQGYYELDGQTAKTQGAYQKFTLAFSRLQGVTELFDRKLSFWSNFVGQLSTKNLDSSEKFSLGGPFGVRAYPVNEALSDEGYLMNFELRYDVYNNIQLVGFVDHGGATLHNNLWKGAGVGPNTYTLSGGGFGINWISPGDFAVKLSVAQRIGDNPWRDKFNQDIDGTRETPHFWAMLSKYF